MMDDGILSNHCLGTLLSFLLWSVSLESRPPLFAPNPIQCMLENVFFFFGFAQTQSNPIQFNSIPPRCGMPGSAAAPSAAHSRATASSKRSTCTAAPLYQRRASFHIACQLQAACRTVRVSYSFVPTFVSCSVGCRKCQCIPMPANANANANANSTSKPSLW